MLFYRCCHLLKRMVSPQAVGLILFYLIGAVLPSTPPQEAWLGRFEALQSPSSPSRPRFFPREDIRRSKYFPKQRHVHTETLGINPTGSPRAYMKANRTGEAPEKQRHMYNDTRRINPLFNGRRYKKFNNTTDKTIARRFKPVQYRGSSQPQIKSTDNEMKFSEVMILDQLQAKIVEKTGKVLKRLDPGNIKSHPREAFSLDPFNLSAKKNNRISLMVSKGLQDKYLVDILDNFNEKTPQSSLSTNSEANETKSINENGSQSSRLLENPLKGNVYAAKDFNTDASMKPSRNTSRLIRLSENGNRSSKFRRGRNFDLANGSKSREDRRTGQIMPLRTLPPNETVANKTFTHFFNYTYHISAMDRGSLFPHDPFDTNKEFEKRSLFSSAYVIPYMNSKSSEDVLAPKMDSIYESLRPRLRPTSLPIVNASWKRRLSSLISSRQPQRNNSTPHVKMRINYDRNNESTQTPKTDGKTSSPSNLSITYEMDSLDMLPKRSDSDYDLDSLSKHQNNSTIGQNVPPLSRKVPDVTNFNQNIPSRTITSTNRTKIMKRQRNSSGRQFRPSSNATRPVISVLRLNKTSAITSEDSNTNKNFNETILADSNISNTSEDVTPTTSEIPGPRSESTDPNTVSSDGSETTTELPESDPFRRPKMSDTANVENVPFKKPRLDPKTFYDFLMKSSMNNASHNFSVPEFRPGNFFRYDGVYPRKPVMDSTYSRPPPFFKVRTSTRAPITEIPETPPTTFESMRTSIRVSSTFYPNRVQDVTMRFGNLPEPPTTVPSVPNRDKTSRSEEDTDDSEYRDVLDPGFTMEKLAYLLIGTCCGLSILCLCVVVIAIKCRRVLVEKRIKAQFRSQMYHHERMKDASPSQWQQQMFDHFMYLHSHPESSRSSVDSCNCRCVTWSLGARNLDPATRPICPTNRSSLYLCGQKKLPFGAASTLRYESMLGRKRPPPAKNETPHADSSPESDSLEHDSDSRDSEGPRHCTCINYTMWPMPGDVRRGMYGLCPTAGHYVAGDCSQHQPEDGHAIPRDCPPPVTGSNYLDRSEGVVYWSSNDERLI